MPESPEFPELVFGLVGAIGTDLEAVTRAIEKSLKIAGYRCEIIKLSQLMRGLGRPYGVMPERGDPDYYDVAMTAGNKVREDSSRNDAIAALSVGKIRDLREASLKAPGRQLHRAYILHSLKRPEELELLRKVYGPSFFAIAAYAPRSARVDRFAMILAEQQHKNLSTGTRDLAERLIQRDESESLPYGQDVRKTYPLADFFIRTSSIREITRSVDRFISLIFGDVWRTPTRDEQGMMLASVASFRSSSPARQVGAAITDEMGHVLSIGCNEVPKSHGGQYWEDDRSDGRDFAYAEHDTSDRMRRNLLVDVLDRLTKLKLLRANCPPLEELFCPGTTTHDILRSAQLFDTIDFVRAVHAESSAIIAAGLRCRESVLYVTTFPCHECARHIAAAGIKRVVYIEPYPKSLVSELFKDSIVVDPADDDETKVRFVPFEGIAPRMYELLFRASGKLPRKEVDGSIKRWSLAMAFPHAAVAYSVDTNRIVETSTIKALIERLVERGIVNETENATGRSKRQRVARPRDSRRKK